MARVTVNTDGTLSLTTTRLEMIGLAAVLVSGVKTFEEMLPIQQAISGDPDWQRNAGEGVDGAITKGELSSYFSDHGLPVPPL